MYKIKIITWNELKETAKKPPGSSERDDEWECECGKRWDRWPVPGHNDFACAP